MKTDPLRYRLLELLYLGSSEMTSAQVARKLGLEREAVYCAVRDLRNEGLIEARECGGGNLLTLTDAGLLFCSDKIGGREEAP